MGIHPVALLSRRPDDPGNHRIPFNRGEKMTPSDPRDQEIAALRERLSGLSRASLHIKESLDPDTVLQRVLDSARTLTAARYGVITTLDESGQLEDFLASGMTPEEAQGLWEMPRGREVFEHLSNLPEPVRADFHGYTRSVGIPNFPIALEINSFLTAPIRHRDAGVGNIYLAHEDPGQKFSRQDEETLLMFAAQAALVIANARQYREERRARTHLETLINTSPVGVAVFNAQTGALVSFNREARRIVDGLGKTDDSFENLLETVTIERANQPDISLEELSLSQALSGGESVRAEEIVLKVPDGRSVTVLVNATFIHTEAGEVESLVVTLQDLTPLEELERLRAELLGMVSHELRLPLTSIRGSATALLDAAPDLDPAEMRQFHRIILDQADAMRELIGDLLDVARIETGTLPVSPEPVEIADLVDRARNTFLNGGSRNHLDIDLAPDLPLVRVDRRRIVQVLDNLLSNAARHSPMATVIRVTAVRQGVHVAVADEGKGISAERLPHLFRKFARPGGEDGAPGTAEPGLGLAISKGIVEAHGGRIRAQSDGPGSGARSTFTIPAVEAAATAPRPAPGSPKKAAEGVRILVVDDDPQALRYARKALSQAGFTPTGTADPEEALLLMEEKKPHLVLLDLVLPDTDGIELMRDLVRIAEVPVIFLSGYGRDEVIAHAFEAGAAEYIVKPFSPTELVARIRAALRQQEGGSGDEPTEPYVLGGLTVDYAERRVTLSGHAETDRGGVRPAPRAVGKRRTGGEPRTAAATDLGPCALRGCARDPQPRAQTPPQARGRRRQPHLPLCRTARRLPHAQGTGTGTVTGEAAVEETTALPTPGGRNASPPGG